MIGEDNRPLHFSHVALAGGPGGDALASQAAKEMPIWESAGTVHELNKHEWGSLEPPRMRVVRHTGKEVRQACMVRLSTEATQSKLDSADKAGLW